MLRRTRGKHLKNDVVDLTDADQVVDLTERLAPYSGSLLVAKPGGPVTPPGRPGRRPLRAAPVEPVEPFIPLEFDFPYETEERTGPAGG